MTIKRRIVILVLGAIIIPAILLLLISNYFLIRQIDGSGQEYLRNAYIIIQTMLNDRADEMSKSLQYFAKEPLVVEACQQKNEDILIKKFAELENIMDYVDVMVLYDHKGQIIYSQKNMKNLELLLKEHYQDKMKLERLPIATFEQENIYSIFYKGSKEAKQFTVEVISESGHEDFLEKVMMSMSMAPIYSSEQELCGFVLVADIINNDNYFPEMYSSNLVDSYLAFSIDGIRIASNIKSNEKNNYIGSKNPLAGFNVKVDSYDVLADENNTLYYGKVQIGNEFHLYIDGIIKNLDGQEVGVIGVGIPEDKFRNIIYTNNELITTVYFLLILIFSYIAYKFAIKITKPINLSMYLIKQMVNGKRDIKVDDYWFINPQYEATQLLMEIQELARTLDKSEKKQLEYEKSLTEYQTELEEKVFDRTRSLRNALTEIRKADTAKSQLLANMSHELKTPLSAIISSSQTIAQGLFGPTTEKQDKYLYVISDNANNLLNLINDILDMSRLEMGQLKLNQADFSAKELLESCIANLSSLTRPKNINIELNVEPEDTIIYVDNSKFRQLITNILFNAIKFSYENSNININCLAHKSHHTIIIRDYGIGIPQEDMERILLAFEQVDNSYSKDFGGVGLGLPIAKSLIELHKGSLEIKNGQDVGTEVLIILPIRDIREC